MEVSMQSVKYPKRAPALFLFTVLTFTLGIDGIYGDNPTGSKFDIYGIETVGEERGDDARSPKSVTITRSPVTEELHVARKSGDEARCRRLEAQLDQPQTNGEAAGGTIVIPSTTISGPGDLKDHQYNGRSIPKNKAPSQPTFGYDTKVREFNLTSGECHPAMTSDSKGHLFMVWEDDTNDYSYLQVWVSHSDGESWSAMGFVENNDHNLRNPSIAVGESPSGDVLLIAYIVEVPGGISYPEVATTPLAPDPLDYTIHSVPIWSTWESYANPIIITDSCKFKPWYAYLTCEGVYSSADGNVNVCTWRSTDSGQTWADEHVAFGNTDQMHWDAPDITFGTSFNRVFLVTFNRDTDGLYSMSSDNFTVDWNDEVLFYHTNMGLLDDHCQPEIAAAIDHDNVMICCTKWSTSKNKIHPGQAYSKNAGEAWTTLWDMSGASAYYETTAVSLTANEGGGSFHVTWTNMHNHTVMYNHRPQDLSDYWQDIAYAVNNTCHAGAQEMTRTKGIASNWDTDVATIAWSDLRDTTPCDYDCYSDFGFNKGLTVSSAGFPADSGGIVYFTLNPGIDNANRNYALFGCASGTSPGLPLPGGHAVLPINWDVLTDVILQNANVSPVFMNFIGKIDATGMAKAQLNCPPIPGFGGTRLNFAFAMNNPFDYASNPVTVMLMY